MAQSTLSTTARQASSSSLGPPHPAYILRGHIAAIHALAFLRGNSRLVAGDAEGWVVVWSVITMRPVAVWRAHGGTVLAVGEWRGGEGVITHGKDNKLLVWQLREEDERDLNIVLPAEDSSTERKQPWLLHILQVNTLNFCAFAQCPAQEIVVDEDGEFGAVVGRDAGDGAEQGVLIAVPNALTSEAVDIFHLPSQRRIHTVPGDKNTKTGMVMAVKMFHQQKRLTLVVGYESGHSMVVQEEPNAGWQILYLAQPHKQPVLSLDVLPDKSAFYTSSADAIIAKQPIPTPSYTTGAKTAGASDSQAGSARKATTSLLSQKFGESSGSAGSSSRPSQQPQRTTTPLKLIQTGHSGQQGLQIRSDGKIFATAGWDSKMRVYSTSTMRELAVLKWHKDGCYTVCFAALEAHGETVDASGGGGAGIASSAEALLPGSDGTAVVRQKNIVSFKERRIKRAESTHWLVGGSKDGKVSLWEIY